MQFWREKYVIKDIIGSIDKTGIWMYIKCCINVKFLKWNIAVWLCKGMSLFFKIYTLKIFRDKILCCEQLILK